MKVRTLLVLTAIVSSILGAIVVYLVLSVPNDLRADAMLKQARAELAKNDEDKARQSLSKIIQQYPRTDAAAAATVALATLGHKDREDLQRAVLALRKENDQLTQRMTELQTVVMDMKNAPPKVVTVEAPPPKPAPAKKAPAKKPTRRRRR
ncbi:MAG TPA: tetratricopeptide repeat protein [Thermoanaerobaculia bacterium]|nr:tetratricopeptide repeat protein [Thermoanaerobaculia bacterium]